MHLNKKFFAPLLSLAAFFSAASARAQDLPEAPQPQQATQGITHLTPAQQEALDSSLRPPALNLKAYDKNWTVVVPPPADNSTFNLPGKLGKMADFAERHSADDVPGFDVAGQMKIKGRFSIVAGTTEDSLRASRLFDGSTAQRWKPEINLYDANNMRVTMKPKRSGVAIGLRIQFH